MKKLISVRSEKYRHISVRFDDGAAGIFEMTEGFVGVAEALNDARLFATARIIDDGMAIGFDGCEYDIYAQAVYEAISAASHVGSAAA